MNAFKLVFESALKYRFYIGVAILSMTGLVALQLLVPWSVRQLLGAVRVQADTGGWSRGWPCCSWRSMWDG